MDMNNNDSRYTIVKLPGKNEGFAIFDSTINSTVAGTRCKTRREVFEAAADLHITITTKKAR